jgi:hypothetical protein
MAVDPNNANHLYVAYVSVDPTTNKSLQVHVSESTDGGSTFKEVYATSIANGFQAAQPAIAVNNKGEVGLLFNSLTADNHLQVHFVGTQNDFATSTDSTLVSFLDDGNAPFDFDPYLGDFTDLTAVGNEFFGAFAATNNDNGTEGIFPQGVTFQRDFMGTQGTGTFQLTDPTGAPVGPSIDPYVFSFAFAQPNMVPEPASVSLLALGAASLAGYTLRRRRRSA